jgi:hypothetical protein
MKSLICDICGGKLITRFGGKGKCDSCGTEFTKENNAEKERLLSNAETFVGLGDFGQARAVSYKYNTDYPYDYRGWWASVIGDTENLTNFYFLFRDNNVLNHPEIEGYQAYKNFLNLAPPERAAEKSAEFEARLNAFLFERRGATLSQGITEKQSALEAVVAQLFQKKAALDTMIKQRKRKLVFSAITAVVLFIISLIMLSFPGLTGSWIFIVLPVMTFFVYLFISTFKDDEFRGRKEGIIREISRDCATIENMKNEMQHKQNLYSQQEEWKQQ